MKNYYLIPITNVNNYEHEIENYVSKMYSELDSLINQLETLNNLFGIDDKVKKENKKALIIKISKYLSILPKDILFKEISKMNGYIILEEYFTKLRIKSMLSEVELYKTSTEDAKDYISNIYYKDKMLIVNDFTNFVSGFYKEKKSKTIEFKR